MVEDTLYQQHGNPDVNRQNRAILERLTEPRDWDYNHFKKVLLATATAAQYIPATNAPESIHIQGLRPFISKLKDVAKQRRVETTQPFFADIANGKLMAGISLSGSETQVRISWKKQPGREVFQRRVLSVHIHPEYMQGLGLSDTDYNSFLEDPEQQVMLMSWGNYDYMAVKTGATPNNLNPNNIRKRTALIRSETIDNNTQIPFALKLDNFNKQVCTELGLTLYIAKPEDRDLARRVRVVR